MVASSISAVLRERASFQPNDPAFTYTDYDNDWDGVPETLTYSQLLRRVTNFAQQLRLSGDVGDRAVILAPQGLDYIIGFLGALEAGLIAVPLAVPTGGVLDERVASVMIDTEPAVVITTSAVVDGVTEYVKPENGKAAPTIVQADLLELDAPRGSGSGRRSRTASTDAATPVYLQYTSGSTRTPAGVMITNQNLFANFEQISSEIWIDSGRVPPLGQEIVSWLPFYHDMGLMLGVIVPILGGIHSKLTSPVAFLQRPARWMQALASSTKPLSAAPNFAFEVAAKKTLDEDMEGFDLGDVFTVINGSERIHPTTLKRFSDRFKKFNWKDTAMRPSYGLAEAVVYVATRRLGQPPEIAHFDTDALALGQAKRCSAADGTSPLVSYGKPTSQEVRIVDPDTSIECPDGVVGEIWIHGGNVAVGYWQKPAETERTFGGKLASPAAGLPQEPWLRTGDQGFYSDGELFILGRIKDLLIVYGRNHSPDDIEATIGEITRGRSVAIAVPDDQSTEKLVAIVEIRKKADSPEDELDSVKREVTSAISKSHGLSVADLVLVPAGSIPITTSGKVRRRECVQLYRRDAFARLDS